VLVLRRRASSCAVEVRCTSATLCSTSWEFSSPEGEFTTDRWLDQYLVER
jgi:hypothetical protein